MAVDDSHQQSAIAITVAFGVSGFVFVVLRLWSRFLSSHRLFLDDWLIIIADVFAIAETVTGYFYIKANHVGIHSADIPPQTAEQVQMGQIWNYANQLLYNPILAFVKLSVLCFLLRLESHARVVIYMIWGTLYFTATLAVAIILVDAFQCTPVRYTWDTTVASGHCIHQAEFFVATAAMTLFTDLLVIAIPMIIVYKLQMPLRRKLAVCGILCIGLAATAVSAWRLDQLIVLFFPTGVSADSTYGIGFVSSPVEVNVAIISACCPALKALLTRLAPRLLGSSAGHDTYGGKTSSSTRYGRGTYVRSHGEPGDSYELGQQMYRSNQQAHIASNNDMGRRIPARLQTAESLSLSDEDGVIAGVMGSMSIRKTTNVTIEREGRSESREKASSVDSLV